MKKILIVGIVLLLSMSAIGQMSDTITQKQIDDIYKRMDMHYEQQKIGSLVIVLGIIAGVVTSVVLTNNKLSDQEILTFLKIGGPVSGGLILIGTGIRWDSHKFFNKSYNKHKLKY